MAFLCGRMRRARRLRQCSFDSAGRLYAGNDRTGKNGPGIFCSDADFIGDYACGTFHCQSDRRKSRSKFLFFGGGRLHERYHGTGFGMLCCEREKKEFENLKMPISMQLCGYPKEW